MSVGEASSCWLSVQYSFVPMRLLTWTLWLINAWARSRLFLVCLMAGRGSSSRRPSIFCSWATSTSHIMQYMYDSDARTAQNCKMLSGIVAGTRDIYFNVKGVPHIEMVFCVTGLLAQNLARIILRPNCCRAYRHTFLLFGKCCSACPHRDLRRSI